MTQLLSPLRLVLALRLGLLTICFSLLWVSRCGTGEAT